MDSIHQRPFLERPTFLFVRTNRRNYQIHLSQLVYLQSQGTYVKFVTDSADYLILTSMGHIESLLPPNQFCRISRRHIVALERIESFDRLHLTVLLNGQKLQLPMSTYKYRSAIFDKVVLIGESGSREKANH